MKRLAILVLVAALAGCDDPPARDTFQGYVDADYLRIAAPEGGWIAAVDVARGARVAAGAPLFTLEDDLQRAAVAQARATLAQAESELADLLKGARPEEIASIEARLAEAEASLDLARIQLRRQEQLIRSRVASEQAFDQARAAERQAEAQHERVRAELATARLPAREDRVTAAQAAVQAARAALAQAEWHLSQRRVASPEAGIIDDVLRRPGEWVPASGAVISLLPPARIKVVFFVPEAHRAAFHPNDTVAVSCTGCPPDLTARISRVAQEAEYTPPVIYSRETNAKLVWRMEAVLAEMPGTPTPGQPVMVRARP